jgi:hypothetical protein
MSNAYYLRVGELTCGIDRSLAGARRYNPLPVRDNPHGIISEWEPNVAPNSSIQTICIQRNQGSPIHSTSVLVPIHTTNSNCRVHTSGDVVTRGKR